MTYLVVGSILVNVILTILLIVENNYTKSYEERIVRLNTNLNNEIARRVDREKLLSDAAKREAKLRARLDETKEHLNVHHKLRQVAEQNAIDLQSKIHATLTILQRKPNDAT